MRARKPNPDYLERDCDDQSFGVDGLDIATVVSVTSDGSALLRLVDGSSETALLQKHVDPAWLSAATVVGPVEAAVLRRGSRCFVWAVYPGPEHADVRAEVVIKGTRIVLEAGRSHVEVNEEEVRLKAKEIQSRATGENWILGARIRLN